jgi:hypothetical protein
MDRKLNNGIIGYIVRTDESLREKEESEARGKEGVSLGTCSARASQLYNYKLRFHLTCSKRSYIASTSTY